MCLSLCVRLKSLLQLMAAAQADRDVVYFTFGNKPLMNIVSDFHSFLTAHACTVGQVSEDCLGWWVGNSLLYYHWCVHAVLVFGGA